MTGKASFHRITSLFKVFHPRYNVFTEFKERKLRLRDYKFVMSLHPDFCEHSETKDAGVGDAQGLDEENIMVPAAHRI